MPKGADLHNHLDGAVYAETFIRVGGEDGLCVDPVAKSFTKSQPIKSGAEPAPVCEAGDVRAADVPKNQRLYDELVELLLDARLRAVGGRDRARSFLRDVRQVRWHRPAPHGRVSRRGLGTGRRAERAISELMETPTWNRLNTIAKDLAWREDLAGLRGELFARGPAENRRRQACGCPGSEELTETEGTLVVQPRYSNRLGKIKGLSHLSY